MSERKPVLVGMDDSVGAAHALDWAASEATFLNAPLQLMHAVVATGMYTDTLPPADLLDDAMEQARQILQRAHDRVTEIAPGLECDTHTSVSSAAALLLESSSEASMIVLGSRGPHRLAELFTGSTSISIAAHARCPVAVVHAGPDGRLPDHGPVMVGVDGSPTSEAAIEASFREASVRRVELMAVHTWSDAEARSQASHRTGAAPEPVADTQQRVLTESLAPYRDRYPDVRVRPLVFHDRPRRSLIEQAKQAQLVVVGSRGRGGFTGMLLGSTSQTLIHHAPCPVLIVRPGSSQA